MRATARKGRHGAAFQTDIERLTAAGRTLSVVMSTGTDACLRGAIAVSEHTINDTSLARHLTDRLHNSDIELDITVSLDQ